MRKKLLIGSFFTALALLTLTASTDAQQVFNGVFSGRQVVPANNSTGTGSCKVVLNAAQNAITGSCNYFSVTSGSNSLWVYSNAAIGQNGGTLQRSIAAGNTSGSVGITTTGLSAQDVADLRANKWYVLIKSNAFPDGDLRAQLKLANGTYNDYDGDGRTDPAVYRSSELTYYAKQSAVGDWRVEQIGQPGDSVSLNVDFDGDGKSDFSTARYNSEVLWRIYNSSTGRITETRWGSSTLGDFFAAGDYDGDGASDIAVLRAGTWYIIESSTGTVRYDYFGQSGDVPAPNDYDRDGKADMMIARSENGQRMWYLKRSSDGQVTVTPWGLSSDAFFTGRADYDGDGAADISVIRTQSGTRYFYILRSSDGQFQVIPWGFSSDLVKLGDYDGDGRTDLAITRTEGGEKLFYIRESSTGNLRVEHWGLPGDF
jgi:hypothetical protein